MTFSKAEYESVRELIPLYVKGLLSDSQKAEVEKAMEDHAGLKDEIQQWKEILTAYKAIEEKIPQPSGAVYSRIAARIREQDCPGLFGRFLASKKLSFAFIAAQFLIILALGIYIVQTKPDYRTLNAPPKETGSSLKINIVFKETATEAEIRQLLLKVNAHIIDGPKRSGLYLIEVLFPEEAEKSLSVLQNNTIVEVAEKSY